MNHRPPARTGCNVLSVLIHVLCVARCRVHAIHASAPRFHEESASELTSVENGPQKEETYTQNQVCQQNNCVNPLFPGLNDLPRLELLSWQCTSFHSVREELDFCKHAINYDVALPASESPALSQAIKTQDDAASTMFFYHLSSLNYEAWEHLDPSASGDSCVRSIWQLACYTYLPKCASKKTALYHRPCASSCEDYLKVCNVECCDESPKCVFEHAMNKSDPQALVQTGYAQEGISCTEKTAAHNDLYDALRSDRSGGRRARRPSFLVLLLGAVGFHLLGGTGASAAAPGGAATAHPARIGRSSLLAAALALVAVSLHGCSTDPHHHSMGNWQSHEDYLMRYEVIPPGQLPSAAQLNSCRVKDLPIGEQCSGRGYCQAWDELSSRQSEVAFCVCDRRWTDPECRTHRKSQTAAFVLSLFAGFLGVDYFYLGFHGWAVLKLFTLGGCGLWWIVDVVRTGSGPVFAKDYRVADDLAHWVFVLSTISFFMMIGFAASLWSYLSVRKEKRARPMGGAMPMPLSTPVDQYGGPLRPFEGYGATIGGGSPP